MLIKFKNCLIKYGYIYRVLISIMITISLCVTDDMIFHYNVGTNTSHSITYFLVFISSYFLMEKSKGEKDKRLCIIASIIATILSIFESCGMSLKSYESLYGIWGSVPIFINFLVRFFSYVILIRSFIILFYKKIAEFSNRKNSNHTINTSKKKFFLYALVIFLCYLPYWLHQFPGILTADSVTEVAQAMGVFTLSNHHPIFHTFLISIFITIGKLFSSLTLGIVLYSLFQMLMCALVFSYCLCYMEKLGVQKSFIIMTCLFFATWPINAIYSFTMWKDIPFSLFLLLYIIWLTKLVIQKESFFEKKRNLLALIVLSTLVSFSRNNGIYVVILTFPFMFIFSRSNWKHIAMSCLLILTIYGTYQGIIFNVVGVKKGSIAEALSIPFQQFARIAKYHDDNLAKEYKDKINQYLEYDVIKESYVPYISDYVKGTFKEEGFSRDKIGLIKLYFQLAFLYPKDTIDAFLNQNYGYWYPDITYFKVAKGIFQSENIKEFTLEEKHVFDSKILDGIYDLINNNNTPIIYNLFSIGFAFWIIVLLFGYVIWQKKYQMVLPYIPIYALWLTCCASPVYAELRYIYGMFIALPLIACISLI